MNRILLPVFIILFAVSGCASMSVAEKAEKRKQLETMAGSTVTRLLIQFPAIGDEIENAKAYLVAHINAPASAGGEGILIVNDSKQRLYFTIGALEVGSGWGARPFKILLPLKTQEMLDRFSNDSTTPEAGAGNSNEYTVYIMSDAGVAVTASVNIIDYRINHELTDN